MASQASTSKSKTPLADSHVMMEIKKLEIDMVIRLSKHFTPNLKEPWEELLTRLSLFLDPADLNQDSFIKIFDKLMEKGIIGHGRYDKLYEVIHQIDVRPAQIIQETSEKIRNLQTQGPSDDNQRRTGEDNSPRTEEDNQKTEIAPRLRPMIETTKAMILEEKEEYNFFQTKSFQVAKEKLLKNRLVVIRGNSGDGKTSMALELLRLLWYDGVDGQRRQPLELHYIQDFESVAPKSQLVIYVDDIFGKDVVCKHDVDEWKRLREKYILSKFCGKEHRDGNFLVITVRNGIFNSVKGSLPKVFTKENIVDVNLDEQEKLELLRLYKPKDNFDSWKDEEERAIIWCAPDLGFPQCCRLFRDTPILHTERVYFFIRPFDFLESSLSKLEDGKFYGLMYLFLKGGKVREDDLDDLNENIDEAVLEEAFAIDVVEVTPVGEPLYRMPTRRKIKFVKSSLDCLLGWLVKKLSYHEQTVCYQFNHDSIEETVALLYRKKSPTGFIQNCPRDCLRYITTSKTAPNQILISSDNQKNAMYNRLVREFEIIKKVEYDRRYHSKHITPSGVYMDEYDPIMSLDIWTDDTFFKGFIRWLNGQHIDKNLCRDIKMALLNIACSSSSEDCVLFLLSEGVKPDEDTGHYVIHRGWVNVLKQIYKYISNEIKPVLLNKACSFESEDCALFLLSEGVIPDLETLFCVMRGGCVNLLRKLLEYDIYTTARADESQSSLLAYSIYVLHEALLSERKEMVFMLFDRYPHLVHDTDELGQSLLHLATLSRDCDLFLQVERLMLNSLCRVEDEQHKCGVHRHCACAQYICQLVDHKGHTVLHTSCYWGNRDVCKYLLEMYPALATVVSNNGETVLHYGCHWGWRYDIKYSFKSFRICTATVYDREPKIDIDSDESFQVKDASFKILSGIINTYQGNRDNCKYLCELFPALTTVVNYNGETVLHYRCKAGDSDSVKYLCESFPALTEAVSNDGETVLHYSCKVGDNDSVKYLCESFPALTAVVSNEGRHCLHYIAESIFSNVDMFIECETHVKQYLESTGCKYDITTIRDNEGNSVLDLAKKGARYRREEKFLRKDRKHRSRRGYDWMDRLSVELERMYGSNWREIVREKEYKDKHDPLYGHIVQLFGQ